MIMILAADLSLNKTALAVLTYTDGQIHVLEKVTIDNNRFLPTQRGHKLYAIYTAITDLLEKYPDITYAVKERGFTQFNGATQALFRVVGVFELAVFNHNLTREGRKVGVSEDVSPTTIKRVITGNGKASKEQVADMIEEYGPFANTDESDAVACGVTFIKSMTGER